ncbi:MAG: 4'-phosphopantetheinyl transferase superfamily protein [Gemmataceae bacterium]|nr:4'-phosphopantetheinyl transferase superfamily protein [Gemmataceae bacterium]
MRVVVHSGPFAPPRCPPPAGEVHLWALDLDRLPAELAEALTPDERDRAARYKAGPVREQFVAVRGAARHVLGGCLGLPPHAVPIVYGANRKPALPDGGLHFNVTHTPGLGLVAVAGRRVGVDAERVRAVPDADGLVGRFFSAAERAAFRALPADDRPAAFLRGWVCKEAVIKAAGASVQYLDAFDVELHPARPPAVLAVRHPALAADGWAVGQWEPVRGFLAAVAVEGTSGIRMTKGE